MEDVIPESESLLLPLNMSPRAGGGAMAEEGREANGRGEDKKVEDHKGMSGSGGKDEEDKGGGIITHLISIVSPRGSTPKAGEVTKRKIDFEVDDIGNGDFSNKSEQEGVCGNENSKGGVISNLISNFFSQSDGGGGGGGGEMNDKVDKEAEKVMKDIGNKRMKVEEEKEEGGRGGGGGIINNIVSHFPTSLPDDAAPSTDEASILITSIVKD